MADATDKAEAATELMRAGFKLNLSFLRDHFAGNAEAQTALTEFSTKAHAAIVGLEIALTKALEPVETSEHGLLHAQRVGRGTREPPAGAVRVLDFGADVKRHSAAVPGLPLLHGVKF